MLIAIVLAATVTVQATLAGACRKLAVPAFCLYAAVMALVPLQEHSAQSLYLAIMTPFYVWYIATIARQNHSRARAAVALVEERNALLAELVMAKIESDRGRERAEAASLAKSQFLANMSHELRTPLNAILGFSEVISTRMFHATPERNYEYAALINSSGHHLLALINDILDLAKIEAGRWKLEESMIDLHRMADDALQLVQWRAKDADAKLENTIDPELDMLYGDERAIKQILLNLLSNAVKFTPEHGRVTAFAGLGADGGMVFGVSDTGVGIAPEDQSKVFDSFGQGKHDVALPDKGTGLGLTIVKGLIEAHGGHVTLESEVGKGTRVSVHLPASRVRARERRDSGELAHFVA
jgi:two-component system cell cycle sensor histidine kinase PleC